MSKVGNVVIVRRCKKNFFLRILNGAKNENQAAHKKNEAQFQRQKIRRFVLDIVKKKEQQS